MEKIYPSGIYFNKPNDKAPDYVLGSISIDIENFDIESLRQYANWKYVRLDVLRWKEKPYVQVKTYKKEEKKEKKFIQNDISIEDIPF